MYRKPQETGQGGFGNVKMAGKLAQLAANMPAEELAIWPENRESVAFFREYCQTQWRSSMGGYTGLDYTAVLASLRTLRLGRDRRDEIFADVRVMESAALDAIHAK